MNSLSSFRRAAVVVAACMAGAVSAQNVAIVNGKAVPMSRVEALTEQVKRSGQAVTPDMEKRIKDEVIAREVFIQEAEKLGLDKSPDFRMQMDLARQTILIRELFGNYQKTHAVTDDEIKAEYDRFVAANSGKEYRARHILVDKEDEAKALIARIKKGAKFEDIAKKSSKDPGSGSRGGDLDWAVPSNYVAEFAQAMTQLGKGQMTEAPVKSQFGWHIIRVDDIREPQLPKLEEVKGQIAQSLQQQKLGKYQEDLRAKARVE